MADSPTRRSSIPILKQTNKTKSFQSYVSLNFTDDQQKSRSPSSLSSMSPPILDNPCKLPPRPQARSMTQSVPKLEIDNDIVITKLCDENKRLKEHQTQLVSKYEEALRENMEIQNKNDELTKELVQSRREVSEKTQLQRTIESMQQQRMSMDDKNKKLQKKLEEILPESIKDEVFSRDISDSSNNDLQNIMVELERLKSYLNQTELQLYEANEHISDLLEKKHEMEVENLSLKSENAELNNLTKLMQANMYETLNTSKRMEETFLRVKTERDELIKKNNRDSTDGGKPRDPTITDEISTLKLELSRQKKAYEAQFIEYTQNLETETEERLNSEIESLKIQVKLLDSELEISRMRAESTEEELRQLKASLRLSAKVTKMDASTSTQDDTQEIPKPPPPPPPPMPNLLNSAQTNSAFRSRSNSQTLNDAINDAQQKLQQTSELKKTKQSTGIEAVIDDLKNGRVTLRRRPQQPRVPLSPKENFTGIYQLLEKNQQQNRISKKILNNELSTAFKKFNLNL